MNAMLNSLGCLLALGCAYYLWRPASGLYKNAVVLACSLAIFVLFSTFTAEGSFYPMRLLALSLCFSTTSLTRHRRRYLVLAQMFWFWVELFGCLMLYGDGSDFAWTRLCAILGIFASSTFLSKISREMEFCLMVFWIAVWIFF